jgi:S-adenosylmethionine:tRNA ribosyltransferase-isomerase
MTTTTPTTTTPRRRLDFVLDPAHEAHEPPEASGRPRDQGRLLVSRGVTAPVDARFDALGRFLDPGDLIVVNTSATVPAALDGRLPGGVALVEVRHPTEGTTVSRHLRPTDAAEPVAITLFGGGHVQLLVPFADSTRLWVASLAVGPSVLEYLAQFGRPIRYRHVPRAWPIDTYQTAFADEPGSAEMPSASRPFTPELVTALVTRGVHFAPLLLHTGVSSLEGAERPYPERYRVPRDTAAMINAVRAGGGHVVAAGTTVVRALATVTDDHGVVHPGSGWTDVVVTPDTPMTAVDGLLTGWHEPESSHLMMLEAFADLHVLSDAYGTALDLGYRWHEFGDSHLILRGRDHR